MSRNDDTPPLVTRPEDVLSDDADHTEVDGLTLRKGTIAAFLRNAVRWTDPETSESDGAVLAEQIAAAIPALLALDVFTVFEVRDERLRELIANS